MSATTRRAYATVRSMELTDARPIAVCEARGNDDDNAR
jgi:hypothetical protein